MPATLACLISIIFSGNLKLSACPLDGCAPTKDIFTTAVNSFRCHSFVILCNHAEKLLQDETTFVRHGNGNSAPLLEALTCYGVEVLLLDPSGDRLQTLTDCIHLRKGVQLNAAASARADLIIWKSIPWNDGLNGASCTPPTFAPNLVLLTSGTSSGQPKIVPLSVGQLTTNADRMAASLKLSMTDICVNAMPYHHIGGICCNLLSILRSHGGLIALEMPPFDPEKFVERLLSDPRESSARTGTWFYAVPTIHKAILRCLTAEDKKAFYQNQIHRLRFIRSGAAHLPYQDGRALKIYFGENVAVLPTSSMTECMPVCAHHLSFNVLTSSAEDRDSVGKPVQLEGVVEDADFILSDADVACAGNDFELAIVNDEGRHCAMGEVGELHLRGAGVFSGYLDLDQVTKLSADVMGEMSDVNTRILFGLVELPNITKESIYQWFPTGDLGRMNPKTGNISLVGRKKEMIKRGGEQVSLLAMETVIRERVEEFMASEGNAKADENGAEKKSVRAWDLVDVITFASPCPLYGEVVSAFLMVSGTFFAGAEYPGSSWEEEQLIMEEKVGTLLWWINERHETAKAKEVRRLWVAAAEFTELTDIQSGKWQVKQTQSLLPQTRTKKFRRALFHEWLANLIQQDGETVSCRPKFSLLSASFGEQSNDVSEETAAVDPLVKKECSSLAPLVWRLAEDPCTASSFALSQPKAFHQITSDELLSDRLTEAAAGGVDSLGLMRQSGEASLWRAQKCNGRKSANLPSVLAAPAWARNVAKFASHASKQRKIPPQEERWHMSLYAFLMLSVMLHHAADFSKSVFVNGSVTVTQHVIGILVRRHFDIAFPIVCGLRDSYEALGLLDSTSCGWWNERDSILVVLILLSEINFFDNIISVVFLEGEIELYAREPIWFLYFLLMARMMMRMVNKAQVVLVMWLGKESEGSHLVFSQHLAICVLVGAHIAIYQLWYPDFEPFGPYRPPHGMCFFIYYACGFVYCTEITGHFAKMKRRWTSFLGLSCENRVNTLSGLVFLVGFFVFSFLFNALIAYILPPLCRAICSDPSSYEACVGSREDYDNYVAIWGLEGDMHKIPLWATGWIFTAVRAWLVMMSMMCLSSAGSATRRRVDDVAKQEIQRGRTFCHPIGMCVLGVYLCHPAFILPHDTLPALGLVRGGPHQFYHNYAANTSFAAAEASFETQKFTAPSILAMERNTVFVKTQQFAGDYLTTFMSRYLDWKDQLYHPQRHTFSNLVHFALPPYRIRTRLRFLVKMHVVPLVAKTGFYRWITPVKCRDNSMVEFKGEDVDGISLVVVEAPLKTAPGSIGNANDESIVSCVDTSLARIDQVEASCYVTTEKTLRASIRTQTADAKTEQEREVYGIGDSIPVATDCHFGQESLFLAPLQIVAFVGGHLVIAILIAKPSFQLVTGSAAVCMSVATCLTHSIWRKTDEK
eukprot:TRINITY_DN7017_c0_g1_i2.p1 TRINITY_DN7017_c0_g1~~TRINITY_DN7017_c0_g1_i2.p1  ORF type:complete len:1589 (+),score=198.64 TRINITY_DN7017_c0_g1_i2:471-4769(+)